MSELAEQVMLAVSTLTGIIDNMVAKNLVLRERSQEDRRIVMVKLSAKGKELFIDHEEHRLKMSFGLLNALDEEDQENFISLFRKITDKIKSSN